MKTNETTKPTLESLGLKCTIVSHGIGNFDDDDKHPMLKWNALFHPASGRPGEAFDYYTGSGCCPKPTPKELGDSNAASSTDRRKSYIECWAALAAIRRTRWTPDPIEILWAIARDGDALESTFEDWASELGYDTDSRKAERTYRACQENCLRLKKILSADQIQILRGLEL